MARLVLGGDVVFQVVKLLAVEKGKKGKQNLVFVVGDRVLGYLGRCYTREKTLTTLLG